MMRSRRMSSEICAGQQGMKYQSIQYLSLEKYIQEAILDRNRRKGLWHQKQFAMPCISSHIDADLTNCNLSSIDAVLTNCIEQSCIIISCSINNRSVVVREGQQGVYLADTSEIHIRTPTGLETLMCTQSIQLRDSY